MRQNSMILNKLQIQDFVVITFSCIQGTEKSNIANDSRTK